MTSKALAGVFRSLRLYHGPDAPRAAMDALYGQFLKRGELAFDIGAHVGDRIASFRRLGADVVALEPQPLLMRALTLLHGRDARVLLIPAAVAEYSGEVTLRINTANPTVSSASDAFIFRAEGAFGWEGQSWDDEVQVQTMTLDRLIATFGPPKFIKIDVEGYEDLVLNGLSQAVPALSFEFTTIAMDVALRCVERLERLGDYRFNAAYGESQELTFEPWLSGAQMTEFLKQIPYKKNSGDIYARLSGARYTDPEFVIGD